MSSRRRRLFVALDRATDDAWTFCGLLIGFTIGVAGLIIAMISLGEYIGPWAEAAVWVLLLGVPTGWLVGRALWRVYQAYQDPQETVRLGVDRWGWVV